MKKQLLTKICGLSNAENINEIVALQPDFMGFIFYQESPRYVHKHRIREEIINIPSGIQKVGVFVNESIEIIEITASHFKLQVIQLHGNESPEFCQQLYLKGYKIIKAFGVSHSDDLISLDEYSAYCEYFLFDTKSPGHGGSGQQFNWQILNTYSGSTPFFLSGGIGLENLENALQLEHPSLAGMDVNSRFEITAGVKDIKKVEAFLHAIKNKQTNHEYTNL